MRNCIILLLLVFTQLTYGQEWKLGKEGNGIKVYTRVSKTSNLKDAKALVTIDSANLLDVFNYFINFADHKDWLYRVSTSLILQQYGDSVYIVYYEADAPWPIQNRDVILKYRLIREKNKMIFNSTVMPDYIPEKKNVVRVRDARSTWIIEANKDGGLDVEYFNHSNPGGKLPVWMVNLVATKMPYQSLLAMKLALKGK